MKLFLVIMTLAPSLLWAQVVDQEIKDCVQQLNAINSEVKTCDDGLEARAAAFQLDLSVEEPEPSLPGFSRVVSGLKDACTSNRSKDGYQEISNFECSGDGQMLPGGFSFQSNRSHPQLGSVPSPYGGTGRVYRLIDVVTRNGASNESYLYLSVNAGGPDSNDVKSVMVLLPRKNIPVVKVIGNNIELTLATGEKVIFDKTTSAIVSGALTEGVHDLSIDRFKRKHANINYAGEGISIRVDHRYEFPTQGATTAEVKQGSRTCQVPRQKIWNANGELLTTTDADLVNVLNVSCPTKPNEKAFKI